MTNKTSPFPIDPTRTAIAIAYQNDDYIADKILPRVPVNKEEFRYLDFPVAEGFTLPDSKIGRKSTATMIDFSANEKTAHTVSFALEDLVPQTDLQNAMQNYDPLDRATERLRDLIALGREKRVAEIVFAEASYASTNRETLSGSKQFNHAEANPIEIILKALDDCLIRPNIMVMGQEVWVKMQQNAKVVQAVYGNSGKSGIARRQAVAEALELEEILIGRAWHNTAAKGKSMISARVWGKNAALLYRNKHADTSGGPTFGFTAQFQAPTTNTYFEPRRGLQGGYVVRVSEAVKEIVVAPRAGYLFKAAVA